MKMYTIFDKKMSTYLRPMFVPSIVEIQRNLINVLKDPKSLIAQFPTDYEIYYIGEWDEGRCEFKLEEKPVFEMNVTELQEAPNE